MNSRTAVTNFNLMLRKLFVFFISIPLALLAFAACRCSGGSRLHYQNSIKSLLRLVLGRMDVKINNYEVLLNTPAPFILAANHVSHLDWMALYSRLKIDISVVSDTFIVGFPFSLLTKRAGFLTIKQKASFEQSREILQMIDAVNKRNPVLIFVNSRTGMHRFMESIRPGAAYLSIKTGAPVIPVRIKELDSEQCLEISFGDPIFPAGGDVSKTGDFTRQIGRSILSL